MAEQQPCIPQGRGTLDGTLSGNRNSGRCSSMQYEPYESSLFVIETLGSARCSVPTVTRDWDVSVAFGLSVPGKLMNPLARQLPKPEKCRHQSVFTEESVEKLLHDWWLLASRCTLHWHERLKRLYYNINVFVYSLNEISFLWSTFDDILNTS